MNQLTIKFPNRLIIFQAQSSSYARRLSHLIAVYHYTQSSEGKFFRIHHTASHNKISRLALYKRTKGH